MPKVRVKDQGAKSGSKVRAKWQGESQGKRSESNVRVKGQSNLRVVVKGQGQRPMPKVRVKGRYNMMIYFFQTTSEHIVTYYATKYKLWSFMQTHGRLTAQPVRG